jgi:FkbM family methyltransferase
LNQAQGFGFGAATTEIEAKAAAELVQKFKTGKVVIFDIGANRGEWSISIRKILSNATILAFEPSKATFKLLEKNVISDGVELHNIGFSNTSGKKILFSDREGSGFASLTKRKLSHFGMEMNLEEEITLVTLNEFVRENQIIPDLLKLDVEGHELDVLNGALDVLSYIQVIQFEFGGCNLDTKTTFQDFWYLFRENNYSLFRLGPSGLIHIPKYDETLENYQTTNYFAVANLQTH